LESIGLNQIINLVSNFGIPGIIFVIWYLGERSHERTLVQYQKDMTEMRVMYERNAELVKAYINLAGDLKDVVLLNTQAWTRAADDIKGNQFCPMIRLKKETPGIVR
jgi:hypothetical protein